MQKGPLTLAHPDWPKTVVWANLSAKGLILMLNLIMHSNLYLTRTCDMYKSVSSLCMLGNFSCFFVVCRYFSTLLFSKYSFRNNIRVSNSLDSDQARHFVGPDLDPNYLQRLSADDKICSKQGNSNRQVHA